MGLRTYEISSKQTPFVVHFVTVQIEQQYIQCVHLTLDTIVSLKPPKPSSR
jgi:hypothetical protein